MAAAMEILAKLLLAGENVENLVMYLDAAGNHNVWTENSPLSRAFTGILPDQQLAS
jgi:hypothetical protein